MIVKRFTEALKKKASVVTGATVAMMISGVMLNASGDSNIMISNAYDIPGVEWNIDDNGTLHVNGNEPDTQIIASRYDVYVSVYLYDITPEGQLIPVSGSYPNFSTAPWYEYKIAEDRDIAALQPYQYPVMKYDFNSAVIGNNISYISNYALYNTGHNKRGHELKQEVEPTVAVLLDSVTILNPECEIESKSAIYAKKICGYEGSTAQTFAEENGYTFEAIGEAPVAEAVYGDADLDGKIGISDVVKVMMYVSNKEANPLDDQQLLNADVYNSGDGVFISDALSIQKKVAQIIDTLPET